MAIYEWNKNPSLNSGVNRLKKDKTWVEISRDKLIHNIKQFRKLIGPDVKYMSVIKSNAYGHGLLEVGKITSENGADWLGVDSIDEALQLRKAEIKTPILILGYTLLERLEDVGDKNISLTVYNRETIEGLAELPNTIYKIHLKIETGTSRQGILKEDLTEILKIIKKYPNIKVEGLSTHYANIEDTTDHTYAQIQLERYKEAARIVEKEIGKIKYKHTACSAAAILFPETYFDMVRVGISSYGLWSSKETYVSAKANGDKSDLKKNILNGFNLKPAITWKTVVAQIKDLKAGTPVSYGLTEQLSSDTKVAILPVGYWDGYDRKLSSVGNVLIKGKRCKVLGRVCMNMIVVDISHIENIKIEDEAVLLGKQEDEEINTEELAQKIGTINYEVITRINPSIKRIVI